VHAATGRKGLTSLNEQATLATVATSRVYYKPHRKKPALGACHRRRSGKNGSPPVKHKNS
jgi:hypothetical protein